MSIFLLVVFWLSMLWLAVVYAGYPLLMMVLARLRPRPLRLRDGYLPHIELITAAFNEEGNIGRKISSYMALDYPRSQLAWSIGSDGSTDATDEIIRNAADTDPSIRLHRYERVGKTRIIYELAGQSSAEIILFTDADITLEPDSLRRIAACFSDPDVGGVVCRMLYHDPDDGTANRGEGLYTRMENALRRWESLYWTTMGPTGQCFAVRRGSYDPLADYRLSDDMHLVISIPLKGFRVWYEPSVLMHEYNARTLRSEIGRRLRVGQQNAATFMEYKQTRLPWRSRTGFQLWCHRVLRNLSTIPAAGIFFSALFLYDVSWFYAAVVGIGLLWILLVAVGYICDRLGIRTGPLGHPLFFTAMIVMLSIGALRAWRRGGLEMWESSRLSTERG
jgi:cellulose synthase/poly-beta-1,6-N-acetylglucosamine synthase-like glycosyltransferase